VQFSEIYHTVAKSIVDGTLADGELRTTSFMHASGLAASWCQGRERRCEGATGDNGANLLWRCGVCEGAATVPTALCRGWTAKLS
jgi:hypothetical protein